MPLKIFTRYLTFEMWVDLNRTNQIHVIFSCVLSLAWKMERSITQKLPNKSVRSALQNASSQRKLLTNHYFFLFSFFIFLTNIPNVRVSHNPFLYFWLVSNNVRENKEQRQRANDKRSENETKANGEDQESVSLIQNTENGNSNALNIHETNKNSVDVWRKCVRARARAAPWIYISLHIDIVCMVSTGIPNE